jgi:hypothetical protein
MLLVKALTGRTSETLSWIDKLDYGFDPLDAAKSAFER